MTEIKYLLENLKLKVSPQNIDREDLKIIEKFLKMEIQAKHNAKISKFFNSCGLNKKQLRTFDTFDWDFNPKIPKNDILHFKNSDWISQPANLVLIGDAGIGKSHIAKALCYEAITKGYSAYFITVFDLVSKLKSARNLSSKINYFTKHVQVLCLDELGYVFHQKEDTDLLFQIISKRAEIFPTIVTTNLIPKNWGSILSGSAATTILDRLNYNGKFLTWEGMSYRMKKK
jgi:DNA replication protein DnaC